MKHTKFDIHDAHLRPRTSPSFECEGLDGSAAKQKQAYGKPEQLIPTSCL